MNISVPHCFGARTLIALATLVSLAASTASLPATDWPRWRGPDLNGISPEKGWSVAWPKEGPKQLWKANIGTGFSSMAVAGGRVFALGNRNNEDTVYCFDAVTGRENWKHSYAEPLDPKYYEGGPSATPTADGGNVYTFSRAGLLFCFEAATGKIVWQKNVAQELGLDTAKGDYWGFAGSPLVEGDLLILNAGAAGVALDKATGKVAWHNGKDACGYATPVPFDNDGKRAIALFAAKAVVAVEPKTGRELWQFPWKTSYDVNAADPIFSGNSMFVSSGYRSGGAVVKRDGGTFTTVWKNQNMHNQMSPSVLIGGHLYGCSGQNGKGGDLRCVDWQTGDVKWKEASAGLGALMAADGKLIVLGEKGELIVAEATPDAFKPLARAQVTGGKCWTAPVLANGRIYCRSAKGDLVCVDVSGKASTKND